MCCWTRATSTSCKSSYYFQGLLIDPAALSGTMSLQSDVNYIKMAVRPIGSIYSLSTGSAGQRIFGD
jgi:hypothetical protein